ncbi:MAG: DUF2924 domain-containing protein [Alphaproteobacteria bacterium]|nr:DUF2924 domain-containing protein [Alphaproteobacteria bacterium]
MKNSVLVELANLRTMTSDDLRKLWKDLYKTESPRANKQYLTKRIAYRIQEVAYGGNTTEIETRLSAKVDEYFGKGGKSKRAYKKAITGSVLVRIYHGIEHQVAVLDDGYHYQGCKYRSLSAIAKKITGMAWSGNAFFGLNKKLETIHE